MLLMTRWKLSDDSSRQREGEKEKQKKREPTVISNSKEWRDEELIIHEVSFHLQKQN